MNHPRSYRTILALAAAVLAAVPASAAGSPKQPWELTPEEHAATRIAHNSEAPGNAAAGFSNGAPVVVIAGSKNPAAFMPNELFGDLVHICFGDHPQQQEGFRQHILAVAVTQGFGKDLFDQLTPIVKPFLDASAQSMRAQLARDKTAMASTETAQCRARASALEAAYARFGKDRFLRLLYQAVAPNAGLTSDIVSVKQLMYVERGCQ